MARGNTILLNGQLIDRPRIYVNKDGKYTKAMFSLKVLRRTHLSDKLVSQKLFFDTPVILTKNVELIQQTVGLRQYDMIELYGVLSTKDVIKTTMCPHCEKKNSHPGTTVYVTPISIERRETGITPEQGLALLKKRCEISNLAIITGTLTRDPQFYDSGINAYAQYNLAVNRRFRIREDAADLKTDYPWVKTFGAQALKDAQGLRKGSLIGIDGALQTRSVERTTVCDFCKLEYHWEDFATEIVPYSTEYLANCIFPETEEKTEQEA